MEKKKVLSGSVQEKGGKLYAVIGYTDPITEKRKTKWIGLDLPKGDMVTDAYQALREADDRFREK
mgnify:CR=1 FL=1